MTRREDGTIRAETRDIARHPMPYMLLLLGITGGGVGGASLVPFATKSDVLRLESKVDTMQRDIAELMYDKRGREWAEEHKTASIKPKVTP